jgi:hypothetical protein
LVAVGVGISLLGLSACARPQVVSPAAPQAVPGAEARTISCRVTGPVWTVEPNAYGGASYISRPSLAFAQDGTGLLAFTAQTRDGYDAFAVPIACSR